jgi:hypothetical protein
MATPKTEEDWAERVHRHLKAELKRANVTYEGTRPVKVTDAVVDSARLI